MTGQESILKRILDGPTEAITDPQDLIRRVLLLRGGKDAMEARHKEELAPIKEMMGKLELRMSELLGKAQSIKFDGVGIAFRKFARRMKVVDREEWLGWVVETANLQMLTTHVSSDAVEEFIATTGESPPGVEVSTVSTVRFEKR